MCAPYRVHVTAYIGRFGSPKKLLCVTLSKIKLDEVPPPQGTRARRARKLKQNPARVTHLPTDCTTTIASPCGDCCHPINFFISYVAKKQIYQRFILKHKSFKNFLDTGGHGSFVYIVVYTTNESVKIVQGPGIASKSMQISLFKG